MREIKLIWDDRDESNRGWFAREYINEDNDTEYTFDADADASASALIRAAGIKDGDGAEVEIYRSIFRSIPDESVTV